MKIRFALLFGSTVLLATMSTWCDSITYPVSSETSRNTIGLTPMNDGQEARMSDLSDARSLPQTPFARPLGGVVGANWFFDVPRVRPVFGSEVFLAPQADTAAHLGDLDLSAVRDRAWSFERFDKESRRARRRGEDGNIGSASVPPTSVSEPGSLALSLVGVIGVGLLLRRRKISQDVLAIDLAPQSE
jgi:hypothetical protein